MWFRHHNYLARLIRDQNASLSDQQVFEEARLRNIATYQVWTKTYFQKGALILGLNNVLTFLVAIPLRETVFICCLVSVPWRNTTCFIICLYTISEHHYVRMAPKTTGQLP